MADRPNILFICTDQQRYDTLGCNGNRVIQTPALDQLAAEGANLRNVFVQSPMCMPSRASLATGRYPHTHRCRWNGVRLPLSERTFMQELADNGYETSLVGKLHLIPHNERTREDPTYGFQHTLMGEHPRPHWASAYRDWLDERYPQHAEEKRLRTINEEIEVWVPERPAEAHFSSWVGEETERLLRSKAEQREPFFIQMSFYDPHHPFDPPEPYASMYDPADVPKPFWQPGELDDKPPHFLDGHLGRVNPIIGFQTSSGRGGPATPQPNLSQVSEEHWRHLVAHYYGMVTLIDRQVARVLQTLRETGLEDNTVVIFTSDHGELLGDHGLLFKGPHHYDCVLRVPTLVRWPGHIPAGTTIDDLVELIDLPATILEAGGLEPPAGMQGRSLLPRLRGEVGGSRESVLVERHDLYWRLNMKTLRTKDWKLTYYAGKPFGELYDLKNDPQEVVNRWDDPACQAVKQELITALLDRLMETEDTLPPQTSMT